MDTLVGRGADSYQATETYRERFGDHSVLVLARGELPNARPQLQPGPAGRARGLPVGQQAGGPGGARRRAARRATGWRRPSRSRSSTGPAPSSTRRPARSTTRSRSRCARRRPRPRGRSAPRGGSRAPRASRRPSRSGSASRRASSSTRSSSATCSRSTCATGSGSPSCRASTTPSSSPPWCSTPRAAPSTPKARFAYLFPSRESALIQVRLKPNLTDDEREQAVALVREAVRMPEWRLTDGAGYTVTGAPVVADDVTDALTGSTLRLLVAGLVLMALVLALVFRSRLRLRAAGDRAGRGGDHVRGDGAARPAADDGLDRRAAGAARARGRLRDPVPGARAGGGRRRAGGAGRGAGDRHRRARHRRRLPRPAALARADGARLRRAAGGGHRDRLRRWR